jgi:3-oxoadipate enol-lactonase
MALGGSLMSQLLVDDVSIAFVATESSGTPVVFLHAFPLNSAMWQAQLDAFGRVRSTIAIDLKGFGLSDAPDDPTSYSMERYADEVVAVARASGAPRFIACGLSMGGYVAFAILRKYPDAVAGLVLADTKSEPDDDGARSKRRSQQAQLQSEGRERVVESLINTLLAESTRQTRPDVVSRARALMNNPVEGMIGALDAMSRRPDSSDLLDSIEVPVLVIVGEHDAVTPPPVSRAMHERIPNAELVTIPDAGHLSNLENPAAFNDALQKFTLNPALT